MRNTRTVPTSSYLSTTRSRIVAECFGKHILEIHVAPGVPFIDVTMMSAVEHEQEVLLPRGLYLASGETITEREYGGRGALDNLERGLPMPWSRVKIKVTKVEARLKPFSPDYVVKGTPIPSGLDARGGWSVKDPISYISPTPFDDRFLELLGTAEAAHSLKVH